MTVILIVERVLHDEMGHFPGQIRSIANFSVAEDIHIITWTGLGELPASAQPAQRPERVQVHRVFASSSEVTKSTDQPALVESEAKSLTNIASNIGATSGDTIVIPSASKHDLRIALALQNDSGPRVVARILTLSILDDLSAPNRDALRKCQMDGRIHLSCETEEMQSAVREKFDIHCPSDFVLPCSVLSGDDVPDHVQGVSFRVGMLGGPRGEKGSFRLPSIVRSIAAQSSKMKDAPKVTLVIQASLKFRMRTLSMLVQLLRAKLTPGNPCVEIIWGTQSGEDYRRALFGLDCVLLPYRLDRYATSGSGVVIDAVNAEVPVIRTRGMAMSQCLSFGNGIEAATDDEFAAAILEMAVQPAQFRQAAKQARDAMQARAADLPFV
ncbi:hypothetical protein N9777_04485 [Ascidiaceihabitans sp.]|nr:hypothetical protein [Ascidiaceihabitans sp.]